MPGLLVVGGGLFGAVAAAYARLKGVDVVVFDARLEGGASRAAAGLFKEEWAGKKLRDHYRRAVPILDKLYGIRNVSLSKDNGDKEEFLFVPPTLIMEVAAVRERVTEVGDGWLQAGKQRYEGSVYVAAGVWCEEFVPGLAMRGKAGASFVFQGERDGRIRPIAPGRQAISFVRDPGTCYFSDGTAEETYTPDHDLRTLAQAAEMGLREPIQRFWGYRPYCPGGPVFRRIGERTWVATGGRKMGTILGASFAGRLVDEELGL